ncbi:MAG: MoaD/ThiS family protein [Chitinophagaceae bacterium]
MTITVLAFGIAKEMIGGSTVMLQVREDIKVSDLRIVLEKQYPSLKDLTSVLIAVNNEYATAENRIREGDEIAIIPPVSGG